MVLLIGPSNGWLYAKGIYSPSKQVKLLGEINAEALEIALSPEPGRLNPLLAKREFVDFIYLSLHLPDYEPSGDLEYQVDLATRLSRLQRAKTAVIHPLNSPEKYLGEFINRGVPLAIENMDRGKSSGFKIEELERLVRDFGSGFVLDVQHAYEHDPTMNYATELYYALKPHLRHLHVSGQNSKNNHSLVINSNNREAILGFLQKLFIETTVPIILEGEYQTSEDLKTEIDFLRKELA